MSAMQVFVLVMYPVSLLVAFLTGYDRGWRRAFPLAVTESQRLARIITTNREKESE